MSFSFEIMLTKQRHENVKYRFTFQKKIFLKEIQINFSHKR